MGHVARRRILSAFLLGSSGMWIAGAVFADPPRVTELAGPKAAAAEPSLDQLLERQGTIVQRLSPELRKRLDAAGREVFIRLSQPTPLGARPKSMLDAARSVASDSSTNLGALAAGDAEALALLVMMQAAKSAEDDLEAQMAGVRSANNSTVSYRQLRDQLVARSAGRNADGGPDPLAGLSSEQQMKMQPLVNRMSLSEAALANLQKKMSETQSTILGSLK